MVNAWLALPAAPKGGRALVRNAAGAVVAPARRLPDLPELTAPPIAAGATIGRSHPSEPLIFDAIPIPEAAPSWAYDAGPERAAEPSGDFSSVRPGSGSGQSHAPSASPAPKLAQR